MCDKFFNILNNGINFVSKQFNTIINNIEKFVKEHKNNTNTNTNTNNTNTNDNNSIILEKIVIDNNAKVMNPDTFIFILNRASEYLCFKSN